MFLLKDGGCQVLKPEWGGGGVTPLVVAIKESSKPCRYPKCAFIKSAKMHRKGQIPAMEKVNNKKEQHCHSLCSRLVRILSKHDTPVWPKNKTPKLKEVLSPSPSSS